MLGFYGGCNPLSDVMRRALAEADQMNAISAGLPGLFAHRMAVHRIRGIGAPEIASVMDMGPLLRTLRNVCDFAELNRNPAHVSVVTTDVATGKARYFNNRDNSLQAPVIIASGSLPPWFAPVKIANRWYWDGSLVTAAPVEHLVETAPADVLTTILKADLWSTAAAVPDNLTEAEIRQKNIRHRSRAGAHQKTLNESQHIKLLLAYALDCIEPSRRESDPRLIDAAVHAGARRSEPCRLTTGVPRASHASRTGSSALLRSKRTGLMAAKCEGCPRAGE
jgi:NTE family protein